MFVIKDLRLNKFKASPVASPRRLFELYGLSKPLYESQQTASDPTAVIPTGARKTQLLELGCQMASTAAEFADDPQHAQPLPTRQPKDM